MHVDISGNKQLTLPTCYHIFNLLMENGTQYDKKKCFSPPMLQGLSLTS